MFALISVLSLIALLPLLAFTYVTWRLVRHREWVAATFTGLLVIGLLVLQPVTQIAADSLVAKPYAEKKRRAADEAGLVGKDFAFVVRLLGEPVLSRVEHPLIASISTRAITKVTEPYTALEYFPTRGIYMGTRFIVFLNSAGNVTSYRVKSW
ncbi:MAG: hypothetical protein ABIQ86_06010 [Steroidobacteraceae bacterium]